MTQIRHTPLDFYDSFGGRVRLSPMEYFDLLGHRGTQTYLVCVLAILVATDAPRVFGQIPFGATLAIWTVVLASFLLCHGVVVFFWAIVQRLTRPFVMPGAVVTAMALVLPVILGESLLHLISHGTLSFAVFPQILFYFVIAETFIMIFMRYVRPQTLPALPPEPPVMAGPEPDSQDAHADDRQILIGAEPVALRQLRHIQAQEHHVHVVMDASSLTHRARLSDIVAQIGAQTDPVDGIQPHRSWWVARHVARALEREGQKHVLYLDDGTRVPVARSRLPDVRNWLEENA